ncbi:MAG TPA: UDP-N-acetylmuramoyl-tripeptide--D-alanyl-D-alanine ligase [Lachnospiraceae bacterium]|nr:UDP-N-acetylmuramoyl-tripeptide--D-alanyl-D-alanine ligase [Lachnospiraceae bacterium]
MAEIMRNMTLQNIAKACGGTLYQAENLGLEITCAVIDSRKMEQGGLFFATRGEKVDGHLFIDQVFKKGAVCVITEKTPNQVADENGTEVQEWGAYILVPDTFVALKKVAAFYRSQLSIPVIGITGSVGKTSTKEFIFGVLSQKYEVLKTEGNFNNEVGLPLTLLRIRRGHQAAVVEMGISDFGEMSRLGEMARPDICVITNIGQCHLEKLHDRVGVLKAKTEIFNFMAPGGEVCLNGEDDLLSMVSKVNGKPVHHFGISPSDEFEVYATDVENLGLFGSCANMHITMGNVENETEKQTYPVEIPLPGQHMVINAMAAALVGKLLHLTVEEIQNGIKKVASLGGRSNIIRLQDKVVIDDCYNANPVSMKAAIDLLATAEGRKVAILGDMFELGENSNQMHAQMGDYAVEKAIDVVLCTGVKSRFMYDAAFEKNDGFQDIRYFADREELLVSLPGLLSPEDTILVKASHGMGFDKVVETLEVI